VAQVFSLRSFWLPVLLVTLVVAAFGAVLGRHGRQLRAMLAQQGVLTEELSRLRSENARLRAERDALLSSVGAAERVAREDFGFAGPGEKVPRPACRGFRRDRRRLWASERSVGDAFWPRAMSGARRAHAVGKGPRNPGSGRVPRAWNG